MRHIAIRLVPYANENKVIHIDAIKDIALNRLAKDRSINHKIRTALKDIDNDLELLIPYQVDDGEKQLKRYIQDKLGTTVNLSELRVKHRNYYLKLFNYGSPTDVLKSWGLDYTFSSNIPPDLHKELLENISVDGTIRRLYADHIKLYKSIKYHAEKEGLSVKDYVEQIGFEYIT